MNRKKYILKDLLQIKNGRDHKDLGEGDIPVYGSGGIMRYANQSIYEKESILLPRKGTLSNIQYVNTPFWTVDTIYYSVVNSEKADAFFLYNYLKTLDLSSLNSGTGVPSMTFGAYYDIEVFLPSLNTQRQIAAVLSALDAKIELNNRINAQLEAMAKTLYDYWFVQFDFPYSPPLEGCLQDGVVNGKPYKSSGGKMVYNAELKREIPEGWEVKKLGDFCSKIGDGIHGTPEYTENSDYYFINGNNLKNGFIVTESDTKKVTQKEFEKYFIDLNEGSILLSINGTLGNLALYIDEKVMLGKSSAYINCTGKNRPYCYQYLKLDSIQKKFWHIATGSTIKNLSLDSIKNLLVPYPNNNLIEKFYEFAYPLEEKRKTIFKENQQLAQLRDWLLPMLMNGQVTVNINTTVLNMAAEDAVGYGK